MCDIEATSYQAGQQIPVFTCNQQLFRVTTDITHDDPVQSKHFYPCISGMHWLMNFAGPVGKPMKNSGLDMLMKTDFQVLTKCSPVKSSPWLSEPFKLLSQSYWEQWLVRKQHKIILQDFSNKFQITERWIRNLICPVLLMMICVRAECEGEFGLHLVCMLVKKWSHTSLLLVNG